MRGLEDLAEYRFRVRGFLAFSETAAEAAGMTAQQYQMLQVVATAEGDACSIAGLAQRLLLKHHSAVELVDRGERAGLVRRVEDAADQRRWRVEMTAKGRAMLERLVGEHLGYLREHGAEMISTLRRVTR